MSRRPAVWFWFRLALLDGERLTVWTVTERGRRAALAGFRRAGVRLVTQGSWARPSRGAR